MRGDPINKGTILVSRGCCTRAGVCNSACCGHTELRDCLLVYSSSRVSAKVQFVFLSGGGVDG